MTMPLPGREQGPPARELWSGGMVLGRALPWGEGPLPQGTRLWMESLLTRIFVALMSALDI